MENFKLFKVSIRVERFVVKNTLPLSLSGIPHVSSKSATKIRYLFIGLLVCMYKDEHYETGIVLNSNLMIPDHWS